MHEGRTLRIGVMSDLHLSAKPYRIRSAMRLLQDVDCILLAGDLTNDGLPEQFELFRQCIEESQTHWLNRPIIPNQINVKMEDLFQMKEL